MTPIELKELFPDEMIDGTLREETMVISNLIRNIGGEEISPLMSIFAITDKGMTRMMVPLVRGLPPDKHRFMKDIGFSIGAKMIPVVAAILVAEAWVKEISQAEAWRAKTSGFPVPSKCPDRQEIVTIIVRTCDGRGVTATAPIVRDAQGRGAGQWDMTMCKDFKKTQENMLGSFFRGYLNGLTKRHKRGGRG